MILAMANPFLVNARWISMQHVLVRAKGYVYAFK